jgi:hypothetical protein
MARDARLLGLLAVLVLSAASPALAARNTLTISPLVEHWNGAAWTQVPVPGRGELTAAVAVSATDVWAVGSRTVRVPFAEHWNGATWQKIPMPVPPGADEVTLVRAAATSGAAVWAVGSWAGPKTKGGYRTLVEHWNGSAWKIVPTPTQHDDAQLEGVAVLSPTNAWAVGHSLAHTGRTFYFRTLALHWNGRRWTRVATPNPGDSHRDDDLRGVVAIGPNNVWAVGDFFQRVGAHRSYQTLSLQWRGKTWKYRPSPNPGGNSHADAFYGAGGLERAEVWAVGGFQNGHGVELPLVERWDGSAWSVQPLSPVDPNAAREQLSSVADVDVNDAWAVGLYLDPNLNAQTLAAHWDGNAWNFVATPNPSDQDGLEAVSAVSASDVWAVGYSESG